MQGLGQSARLELRSTHCVLQIPSERIEIESDNDGLREFISGTLSDIPPPTPPSLLSYPTFCDSSTFMQTAACSSRSQHLLCNQHLNVRFFLSPCVLLCCLQHVFTLTKIRSRFRPRILCPTACASLGARSRAAGATSALLFSPLLLSTFCLCTEY